MNTQHVRLRQNAFFFSPIVFLELFARSERKGAGLHVTAAVKFRRNGESNEADGPADAVRGTSNQVVLCLNCSLIVLFEFLLMIAHDLAGVRS